MMKREMSFTFQVVNVQNEIWFNQDLYEYTFFWAVAAYACILSPKTIPENFAKFSLDNRIELKDHLSFNRLQFLKSKSQIAQTQHLHC